MTQIEPCEMCHQRADGKRYDFYYGQFLGNTDVFIGGPGTVGNRWTEHYKVIGHSDCFLCKKCVSAQFWRRVFKEPRLPELNVRWFDLFLFFIGFGLVTILAGGLANLLANWGYKLPLSEDKGLIVFLVYSTIVSILVLLVM